MSDYELPRHRHGTVEEPWNTPNISNHPYPPSSHSYGSQSTVIENKPGANFPPMNRNDVIRTPSPTPSEAKELNTGAVDWQAIRHWRFWIRREWLWYYVALFIILVLTALMTIYHSQIVNWLTPVTRWMHDLKFGWLVPIGILFVISFPPLFGHEIVAILCGLVWGLWAGFGIVAAGTFIGEVGNFYAFKYCCRARGEKMERTKIPYACLAKVVRQGGFKIALIARLSAIPGHFTTAVFSTCGMNIFVFSIAAILSLPKQFITVYLGVILEESSTGGESTKSRIISDVVLTLTFAITIAAMWYIYREMNRVKPEVIYERRKARQAKMALQGASPYSSSTPYASDVNVPFTSPKPQYPFASVSFGSTSPKIVYAPSPAHDEYKPGNNYNNYGYASSEESVSSSGHLSHSRPSMDNVSWETGQHYQPPPGIPPQPSYSASPYGGIQDSSGSRAPQSNNPASQSYPMPPHSRPQHLDMMDVNLKSPPLPNPYGSAPDSSEREPLTPRATPMFHHEPEPTGMSYHTAVGSDDDDIHSPDRSFSPPPSNYMTNLPPR